MDFQCDTETELPSTDVIDGDTAFTKDSKKEWRREVGVWVEWAAYTGDGGAPMFGNGASGSEVLPGGQTTLTNDRYWINLTVPAGTTLITAGYRIFVRGTLTLDGIIRNNGVAGGPGSAFGVGAAAGTLGGGTNGGTGGGPPTPGVSQTVIGVGGSGGDGGANGAGTHQGALGGTVPIPTEPDGGFGIFNAIYSGVVGRFLNGERASGGAGGGGGGQDLGTFETASGGGGGGGVLVAAAAWAGAGAVEAKGGNGGNSGANGGGGGGGGFIVALSGGSSFATVTFSVAGGAAGTGGGSGQNGTGGVNGKLYQHVNS